MLHVLRNCILEYKLQTLLRYVKKWYTNSHARKSNIFCNTPVYWTIIIVARTQSSRYLTTYWVFSSIRYALMFDMCNPSHVLCSIPFTVAVFHERLQLRFALHCPVWNCRLYVYYPLLVIASFWVALYSAVEMWELLANPILKPVFSLASMYQHCITTSGRPN